MTLQTRLTEKLSIRHPVLLAPMGAALPVAVWLPQ
jgi:NAD(P)H-dependent flavin oxidoreductase YrpB (nitropropane dioxygenase family)